MRPVSPFVCQAVDPAPSGGLDMILVMGEDPGLPRRLSPGWKLRRVGKACLAATIKERSNLDAGLEGRGPVPPRDQRPLAIEPSAAKA